MVSSTVLQPSLLLSGDAELNPGPKRNSSNHFTIFYWNLNSTPAHSFAKVFLLKVYIAIHKFNIACISGTYLDSLTGRRPVHPAVDVDFEI